MKAGGYVLQSFQTRLEELCEKNPRIVQEMADEGDIISPFAVEICQKHGIKFSSDFLKRIESYNYNGGK